MAQNDAVDWVARPISPAFNTGQVEPRPAPLLRRSFAIDRPVARAMLHVSALGVQQCWLNGRPVSDDLLEPGWTAYAQRLLYASHDVTALLREGENVLAGAVGDGWWRGKLTWLNTRAVYGDTTALLAQLEIDFADGSRAGVATDAGWRGGTGAVRMADLYDGCDIDLALEPAGWREPGFDDAGWSTVDVLPLPAGLERRSAPPVRVVQRFPVAVSGDAGLHKVDCGQNLTGYLRLHVTAKGPALVTVRHAEVLEDDGRLHTAALRGARATDTYRIHAGSAELEPVFTFHGFRHAEIAIEGDACLNAVEACVVSSDLREIGRFACSDERINRLDANIRWSQRGNFVSLPTDCPQRDERMGWTGDIQVFAPTACANFDCRAFLSSWLIDLAIEQAADGQVPSVVPNVIPGHPYEFGGIGWADAATLVPWAMYEAYGDRSVLERQFDSMRRWVDYGASRLSGAGVWTGDFHLGDWLDPGAPPDKPEEATTDRDFIASAYLSFSAGRVAAAAEVLGLPAQRYAELSRRVAAAAWERWRETLVRTQTGCALAIGFDIAPPKHRAEVGRCLAALVEAADGRIATGFLGTPLVLPALTATGQHDAAFRLLLNEQAPGWLYQVARGATTMWERWDAILPDGSINRGEMAVEDSEGMMSFNHYAYGAVGLWLYRALAGIAPAKPGYLTITFAPQPGGGIGWAEAEIDTPLGPAGIRWDERDEGLSVRLTVPPGATARFDVPASFRGENRDFGPGRHEFQLMR